MKKFMRLFADNLIGRLRPASGLVPRGLFKSSSGSVTIEVAIVVPLMLIILLGFTEMYFYIRAVSQVEHTAFTVADTLGEMTGVINSSSTSNANNLGSIWNDATLIDAPNNLSTEGGVIITSVCDAGTAPCGTATANLKSKDPGTPRIWWQAQAPFTTNAMPTTVVPGNILPTTWPFRTGDSALVVEVFYYYNPFSMVGVLWADAPGVQKIYRKVYVRPRSNQPLPLTS